MERLRFNSLSYLRRLLAQIKLLFHRKREPEDPFAYSMARVRRPPHGRGGAAVADVEMDDLESK
jgi:hypothetical protein